MKNPRIKNLKTIAEEISQSPDSDQQIRLLTRGFELFSEETERLDQAYAAIKAQFQEVNHKLKETNDRLESKVQELHVLTSYLDNILSHMAQGLIFIDLEGHITTYNAAAEAIFEIPKNQVLYQKFSDHFLDSLIGFSMEKALKTQEVPHTGFFSLDFPDGKHKDLEVQMTFVPKKEEGLETLDYTQGLILLLRDITELRRLQTAASRKDRMQALGEMAAQVAHEIRNPLGGIKGFAALLHRDLKSQPEQLRLTNYILEGAGTLERLVTQVLNYSRPIQLELKTIDIPSLLHELKESLEGQKVIDLNISFEIQTPKKLTLLVDPGLLQSALLNLIVNALQAMPEGGTLSLILKEEKDKVILQVKDTGIGIAPEHIKKLFSPFFSTKADGNGLGLAEAHKVIQAHGGEISVDSTVGKGTTFTIKLGKNIVRE